VIAHAGGSAEDAGRAAHEAFASSNLYPLRYELALITPWEVKELASQVF